MPILNYGGSGGTAAKVRRAMAVLSSPVNGTLSNAEITWRVSNMIPTTTTRWRIRIRNYLLRTETVVASGASFVGIYHGEQALDTAGALTAGFAGTPRQAVGAFTLAADGTEYVGTWITADADQITGGKPWLFSLAYTGGGTQGSSQGQMWYKTGAGSSTSVNQSDATGFSTTGALPFDVRVEYEALTTKHVVLVAADSISYGTASAVISQQHSWPSIYANRHGHLVMNGGIPSSTAAEWSTASTLWKYQRFNPAEITIDDAWVFLGTNDLTSSVALTTYRPYILAVMAIARGLGATRVGLCTITPRAFPHGVINKAVTIGATTLVLRTGGLSAGTVQLGDGGLSETVTLSASPTDNGDGTYTYTITAATKVHAVGEIAALSQETLRLSYNAFLRALPGGAHAVAGMDRAWEAAHDRAMTQGEFVQTDNLHPTVPGAAELAARVPA